MENETVGIEFETTDYFRSKEFRKAQAVMSFFKDLSFSRDDLKSIKHEIELYLKWN